MRNIMASTNPMCHSTTFSISTSLWSLYSGHIITQISIIKKYCGSEQTIISTEREIYEQNTKHHG